MDDVSDFSPVSQQRGLTRIPGALNRFYFFSRALGEIPFLGYGISGVVHSVTELAHHPLAVSGAERALFNTFPIVTGIIAALEIHRKIFDKELYLNYIGMTHLEFLLSLASDFTVLAACLFGNKSSVISPSLTAFGLLSDVLAFQSIIHLLIACNMYRRACNKMKESPEQEEVKKEYEFAKSYLTSNVGNVVIWLSIALAHSIGIGAAPILVGLGSLLLVAFGIRGLYDQYRRLYPSESDFSMEEASSFQRNSR